MGHKWRLVAARFHNELRQTWPPCPDSAQVVRLVLAREYKNQGKTVLKCSNGLADIFVTCIMLCRAAVIL